MDYNEKSCKTCFFYDDLAEGCGILPPSKAEKCRQNNYEKWVKRLHLLIICFLENSLNKGGFTVGTVY